MDGTDGMNNKIKSVFVTGGAGYCGSLLVPKLLQLGFKVTVYDLLFFGCNHLPVGHENLKLISGDIRDIKLLSKALVGHDAFLNLACISNDASFEIIFEYQKYCHLFAHQHITKSQN